MTLDEAVVFRALAGDDSSRQNREQFEQVVAETKRVGAAAAHLRSKIALAVAIDLGSVVDQAGKIVIAENRHRSLLTSWVLIASALVGAERADEIDVVAEHAQHRLPGIGA